MSDTKQLILDIAMNLNRIGNWIADDFENNEQKINVFLKNNDEYILKVKSTNSVFQPTWDFFMERYQDIKLDPKSNAENFMTFGNILTHRTSLIE